jgi:sorbitol-specific phosphotransferase system component IIBC
MKQAPRIKDARDMYNNSFIKFKKASNERRKWFLANGWRPITKKELLEFKDNPKKKMQIRCFAADCGCYGERVRTLYRSRQRIRTTTLQHTGNTNSLCYILNNNSVLFVYGVSKQKLLVEEA